MTDAQKERICRDTCSVALNYLSDPIIRLKNRTKFEGTPPAMLAFIRRVSTLNTSLTRHFQSLLVGGNPLYAHFNSSNLPKNGCYTQFCDNGDIKVSSLLQIVSDEAGQEEWYILLLKEVCKEISAQFGDIIRPIIYVNPLKRDLVSKSEFFSVASFSIPSQIRPPIEILENQPPNTTYFYIVYTFKCKNITATGKIEGLCNLYDEYQKYRTSFAEVLPEISALGKKLRTSILTISEEELPLKAFEQKTLQVTRSIAKLEEKLHQLEDELLLTLRTRIKNIADKTPFSLPLAALRNSYNSNLYEQLVENNFTKEQLSAIGTVERPSKYINLLSGISTLSTLSSLYNSKIIRKGVFVNRETEFNSINLIALLEKLEKRSIDKEQLPNQEQESEHEVLDERGRAEPTPSTLSREDTMIEENIRRLRQHLGGIPTFRTINSYIDSSYSNPTLSRSDDIDDVNTNGSTPLDTNSF